MIQNDDLKRNSEAPEILMHCVNGLSCLFAVPGIVNDHEPLVATIVGLIELPYV